MKRSLKRRPVALALAVVALAISVLPVSPAAAGYDSWSPSSNYGSYYGCYHSVFFGETLSGIASRYGTSAYYLTQINGIPNPNLIYAGTALRVPCSYSYTPQPYPVPYHNPYSTPYYNPYSMPYRNPYNMPYPNRYPMPYSMPYQSPYSMPYMNPSMPYQSPYSTPYMNPNPMPYPTPSYGTPSPMAPPAVTPTPVPGGALTVVIRNLAFNSSLLTIHVGQTVVWRNDDGVPHTTTSGSCAGSVCTPSAGWDSGTLNPGQSFSQQFTTMGTFPYFCRIHGAMMQGTIVVIP